MKNKYSNPKVSVIIPTFNRAQVLERSVKSVLSQSYSNFELLVVDDGSTDNTSEIMKKICNSDERIKYIKYYPNKGGNVARNLGIKNSRGEYIAFLDSDDEWLPKSLEERLKAFEKLLDDYGLVYCQSIKKLPNSELVLPEESIEKKESVIKYLFENHGTLSTCTLMIRKKILIENDVFFDEDLKRHQDWDFVIRLKKYVDFYFVKKPLTIWHAEDAYKQLGNKFNLDSSFKFIKKHEKEFNKNPEALTYFLWTISTKMLRIGRIKEARQTLKKILIIEFSFKTLSLYLVSFLGQFIIDMIFKVYYKF